MTKETWGPWIEHRQNSRPVGIGEFVNVQMDCGCKAEWIVCPEDDKQGLWEVLGPTELAKCDICGALTHPLKLMILRYRIRQFSALEDLKRIAEAPQEVDA